MEREAPLTESLAMLVQEGKEKDEALRNAQAQIEFLKKRERMTMLDAPVDENAQNDDAASETSLVSRMSLLVSAKRLTEKQLRETQRALHAKENELLEASEALKLNETSSAQLRNTERALHAKENDLSEALASLKLNENDLDILESEIQVLQQSLIEKENEKAIDKKTLTRELLRRKERIDALELKVSQALSEIRAKDGAMAQLEKRLEKAAVDQNNTRSPEKIALEKAQNEIRGHQVKIQNLSEDQRVAKEGLESIVKIRMQQVQTQLRKLKESLDSKDKELAIALDAVDGNEKDLDDLERELETSQMEILLLKKELEDSQEATR